MALQNGEDKVEDGSFSLKSLGLHDGKWVLLILRVAACLATASATIVMALNKETKSFVIATIGTTPLRATITAKFYHTPAFVFFVVANGMATIHNLAMILGNTFAQKLHGKGVLRLAIIAAILDMMTVGLVSGGVNAAAFMAELGKNGNAHARWDKICDKFDTFCDHAAGALLASLLALLFLFIISAFSIIKASNSIKYCSPLNVGG
ncbi:hypothetical protein Tsubulata_037572, partial [Turnera subulata]